MNKAIQHNTKNRVKSNYGFSLIELLIAVALSSIVAIVVVSLFSQTKTSYISQENNTRLEENGRYAIQLLTKAVRSADFWGCIPSREADPDNWPETGVISKVNGLPRIGADNLIDANGISGIENAAAPGPGGYPTQPDTLVFSGIQRGRSFPLRNGYSVSTPASAVAPLTISLGATVASNIQPNDIMIIADCQTAEVFQVTNDVDTTVTMGVGLNPNTATISHGITSFPTIPASPYNNLSARFVNPYSANTTSVYRGVSTNITYTINPNFDHDGNVTTPTVPTLMRSVDGGAAQAIVPGVENLQIMFGEDTNTPFDGRADRYVTANNISTADFSSVVSVRISIVVRSPEARSNTAAAYTVDGTTVARAAIPADANGLFHTRKVYTTTITVRNRTG